MGVEKQGQRESFPLLPTTSGGQDEKHGYTNRGFDPKIKINKTVEFWEDKEWNEDKVLFSYDKRRGTSMITYDCFLVILDYLQIYTLLQSLSLRWPWPQDWINYTSWVFLFNIDIWDFSKVYTNGTYKNIKDYYIPSAEMPYQYWQLLLGWLVVLCVLALVYAIVYIILNVHKHPYMMVHIAHLQRAYVVIAEILALPLGLTLARIFNCKPDASVTSNKQLVDISNDLQCFDDIHWAYMAPSLFVAILLFLILPTWLIYNIRQEVLAASSDQHEGFLQLKETEYIQGLDMVFIVKGYPLFSSFRLWGVYYRPALLMLKFSLLIFYATLFQHSFAQALVINLILAVMFIAFAVVRPFRVKPFNAILVINYLCLMANCLLGTMMTSFDTYTVQSPWLTPTYMNYIVIFINGFWLFAVFVFLLYILLRHFSVFKRWIKEPLWPSMTSRGLNKLNPETRKFMRGILRARHLLERCLSMPPIFAPAHELSRQIQIINAYCREAEFLQDPIHPTLWDLLDDMIESYSKISPKSLFSESVKDSIRQTAAELMKLMPMFVRRLAQREYDFILVTPVKRRLLLKMYCMGLFLNGRKEKIKKAKVNVPAMRKIWRKNSVEVEPEEDDGYYEEMYPERMQGPNFQHPEMLLDLEPDSDDDDEYFDNLDTWTRENPTSRGGPSRLSDDLSRLLGDDISLNLSEMMAGIPSLHGSRPASSASRLVRHSITSPHSHSSHSRSASSTMSADIPRSSTPQRNESFNSQHADTVRPKSSASRTSIGSSPLADGSQDQRLKSSKSRPKSARPKSARQKLEDVQPSPVNVEQEPESSPDLLDDIQERVQSPLQRPTSAQMRQGSAQARPQSALDRLDSEQQTTDSTGTRPGSVQSRPGSAQQRPESAQRPTSGHGSPDSSHERPQSAQQRPDSAQQEGPVGAQDRPGSAQPRPGSAQSRPGSAIKRPESAQKQPRPDSAQDRPGSGQQRPVSAQNRPESAIKRPESSKQQRPGSAQDRSGSAQLRPGSAKNKSVVEPTLDEEDSLV